MGRIITIYRGDEHRAKIEEEFLTNDIFADVYRKAGTLVREISDELKQYDRETDEKYLLRYHGMRNNIITFCGERGQGKTSALQSFVKHLPRSGRKADNAGAESIDFPPSDDYYEVIDSIDPSAMENGESLLRVLISRLFFRMNKCPHDTGRFSEYDNAILQKHESIVKLFEKCYQNIDYIKSDKCSEYEQDDLDTLSQLGSSAKLKANLHDLIEKYLEMTAGSDCGEKQKKYLVIPIDDADLATKKVFELCEDIRNYLSIPNVIILMAVDYEQLVQATYQEYLKQFRITWQAEGQLGQPGQRSYMVEKCHEMAARYLEKVFPATHRIDLPKIDYMLMEGYEDIQFVYIVPDDKAQGAPKHAFEELYPEDCSNLQDQLLEILYRRTGLVFAERGRKMHLFLPHTLRELAHWVKMLYDMHKVDCDDLYQRYQNQDAKNPSLKEDIEKLKDNILTVKQYFMNYWCEKYLDISEVRVIQRIDQATRRKQMTEVKNILYEHRGNKKDKTESSFFKIIHDIVEKELESESHFQEAVYIYYTIFLNEWFAAALEDDSQFERIACFVEKIMDLSEYNNANANTNKVVGFLVKMDVLQIMLGTDTDPATQKALESFCVAVRNGKIVESVHIMEYVNQTVHPQTESYGWQFDVLRPIIHSLKGFADSSREKLSQVEARNEFSGSSVLVAVRNIVANCDVQWQVRNVVDSWYETNTTRGEFAFLSEQIPNLYNEIEDGMGRPKSRKDKELIKIYENTGAKNNQAIDILYLCNKNNFDRFVAYLNNTLDQLKKEIVQGQNNEKVSEDKWDAHLVDMIALQDRIEDGLNKFSVFFSIDKRNLEKCFEIYGIAKTSWEKILDSYDTTKNEKDRIRTLLEENGPIQNHDNFVKEQAESGQNQSCSAEEHEISAEKTNNSAKNQENSGKEPESIAEGQGGATEKQNHSAKESDSSAKNQGDSLEEQNSAGDNQNDVNTWRQRNEGESDVSAINRIDEQ